MLYVSDPREIILEIKKVIADRKLSPADLVELMETTSDQISMSTARRIMADGSEDVDFSFRHVVLPIANRLCCIYQRTDEDTSETVLMKELILAKASMIEKLEKENALLKSQLASEEREHDEEMKKERMGLEQVIDFRTARISRLDDLLDKEREANAKLTDLVSKLIEKCDQCEFHHKQEK